MAAIVNDGRHICLLRTGRRHYGDAGNSVMNFGTIHGLPVRRRHPAEAINGGNNLTNFGSIIADLNGSAIEMDTVGAGNLSRTSAR